MKRGFSIAEMFVSLAIIGILSALTIPLIIQSTSSNTKVLYKAAYKNVESVINELINDVTLYPSGEFINNTFCSNFFAKINTIGTVNCANTFTAAIPDTQNVVTSNGMRWYNIDNDFGTDACPGGASGSCVKISIDVDGAGKGINLNSGDDKDILDIYIFQTGKITVPSGTKEEEYLTQ